MILGFIKLDVNSVGNHHVCRLGKWLETLDQSNSSINNILSKIEKPHSSIHEIAKTAIQEYEKGNVDSAERMLGEIEKYSDVVVGELNKLKEYLIK